VGANLLKIIVYVALIFLKIIEFSSKFTVTSSPTIICPNIALAGSMVKSWSTIFNNFVIL
jgi:hypothetical protein